MATAQPGIRATIHKRHPLSPDLPHRGALKVVHRLKRHGYETYFAGGCVRDFMLEIAPRDYDVATAASGPKVDAIFFGQRTGRGVPARTLPSEDEIDIDIISFGAPPWTDLAHWRTQKKMEQASLAEAFIKSFDYTINALYYDPTDNVIIDFVNGVEDIRTRTLRLVRPAEFRLCVVTVLRGVGQCSKKDLRIDEPTWRAMCNWASVGDLRHKKPVHIFSQMVKMLRSGVSARCFEILERMGAMRLFLGRSTIPISDFTPVRRLLAAFDRVSTSGLGTSVLFATLFYHPIELALGRSGTVPNIRSLLSEDWAARQRALSAVIEPNLRPLAEPFAIPKVVYRDTHNTLLAVRLMREGWNVQHWRNALVQPWWKGAARLLEIVRDVER